MLRFIGSAVIIFWSTLAWADGFSGSPGAAGCTPAGSTGSVQYYSGGLCAGDTGFTYAGSGAATITGAAAVGLNTTTSNATGTALYGNASGTTGANFGVQGISASATGYGVYGANTASAGVGLFGTSSTGAAIAIEGYTTSTTANATAIYGYSGGATGATYAVYGQSASSAGYGGLFSNSNGGYSLATNQGNAGIGTLAPTAKLDVSGPLRVETDSSATAGTSYTSNTSLAAIPGLTSGTLIASKTYEYEVELYFSSCGASGGVKVDMGSSTNINSIVGSVEIFSASALASSEIAAISTASGSTVACTHVKMTGVASCTSSACTLVPRGAQNASNATATTIAGGFQKVRQLN